MRVTQINGLNIVISEILSQTVDWAWSLPLVLLLILGGFYLLWISRFIPFFRFRQAVKIVCGKFKHPGDDADRGQINHFKALTNALSATIGMGNIAGVAVAISQGGPGAIFWMWVAGLIGMNTKFFECTLAVLFRGTDYRGEIQGGPMYVIKSALSNKWRGLAYMFAVCGLLGTLPLFQANQLSAYLDDHFSVSTTVTGVVCAVIVAGVLFGGIRRLAIVTSSLVPFMCTLYVLSALVIIFININQVPTVFKLIFTEAFTGGAIWGGGLGIGVIAIMKIGVKRAAFSNEAGIGTASMAHSNAKTSEPISEGLVAMLGPFLDTIVVCSITALVILTSLTQEEMQDVSGIIMIYRAYDAVLPGFGTYLLGLAIILFSITTIIGYSNYNQKCWNFLFQGKRFFTATTCTTVFCSALIIGATRSLDDVINLLDIGFALMAWPNMICTLLLASRVKKELGKYLDKYGL